MKYYAAAKDLQKRGSANDESSSKENLVTPEVVSSAKNSLAARDPENTNTSCHPLSSAVREGSDDKMNESIETQTTEECVPCEYESIEITFRSFVPRPSWKEHQTHCLSTISIHTACLILHSEKNNRFLKHFFKFDSYNFLKKDACVKGTVQS